MDQQFTKKQFIDTMRVERARWEMLLLRAGPGRMSLSVGGEGPSVLEVIGALYEKEHWLVANLASIQALPVPDSRLPMPGHVPHASIVDVSRRAFNEILRLLIPISEPDLFVRDRFPWAQGRTLAEVISSCTIYYYREHDPPIRSWLSQPVAQVAV